MTGWPSQDGAVRVPEPCGGMDPGPQPRTVLLHINVEVPGDDPRNAGEIAQAVEGMLEVGGDDPSVVDLTICVPLAEEI